MARLATAGGEAVKPLEHLFLVNQWVEWEASTLRPATYTGVTAAALEELAAALQGKQFLVGGAPTLADVSGRGRTSERRGGRCHYHGVNSSHGAWHACAALRALCSHSAQAR